MDRVEWEDGANCRLVRADGTEWRVMELRGVEHGLRVDAVRAGRERSEPARTPANGNGTPGSNGSAPGRLEDELLGRGDRLQWLNADGQMVWSMKLPMDQARSA